jgi:hypothetical protein
MTIAVKNTATAPKQGIRTTLAVKSTATAPKYGTAPERSTQIAVSKVKTFETASFCYLEEVPR